MRKEFRCTHEEKAVGIKKDITEEITRIAATEEHDIELAHSALRIACVEYPTLNESYYLEMLNNMAARLEPRIQGVIEPQPLVQEINRVLFDEEGFRGNIDQYYDPRNSFLNEVLDRKLGIPITLSIVYIEVGRRAGLRTYGIGLPGHFVTGLLTDAGRVFINPFNKGEILSEQACRRIVRSQLGASSEFKQSFLDPTWPKQILVRLMRNLKAIYGAAGSQTKALYMVNWILMLAPDSDQELRERGLYYESVGDFQSAAKDLEKFLELNPGTADEDAIRAKIALLKKNRTPIH
jgi:regulator of sirC expression with transglutaminase-like and TPR domain